MLSKARYSLFLLLLLLFVSEFLPAQVAWVRKFDDALKQAQVEGKFIVIEISASWCPPCQKMAREVYPDGEFVEFSRSQVFMLLDADNDPEGVRLAGRFNVHSYPTILVLDAKGHEIDRLTGGRTAKGLIKDLKDIFADPMPFDELLKRAAARGDDFQVQFNAGKRAFDRSEYSRARQLLDRAGGLAGSAGLEERISVLMLLSVACFRDGKYQDALRVLDTLEKEDPRILDKTDGLKMHRARILIALKRHEEGYQIIRDLLRSSRSRSETEAAKKLMAELPGKYRRGDKDYGAKVEKIRDDLKKGKIDLALDLAGKAAQDAPQAAEAHMLLASAHFQKSQRVIDAEQKNRHLVAGLNELRLARRLDPEDLQSYAAARSYMASKYLPAYPNSPDAKKTYQEAEERFALEQYRDAAKLYLRIIQMEPQFGLAYRHLGDCYFASGGFEDALNWYRQAAAKSPLDAAAYRYAAHALTKLGRKEEAREYVIRSLMADPEYPLAWQNLEETARSEGRNLERHSEIIPFQFLLLSTDTDSYDESLFDSVPPDTVPAWREYVKSKLLWRQEKFQKQFPNAQFYHTTFQEELDCLQKLTEAWSSLKEETPSLHDDSLDFVRQVAIDGKLEAFVFLELYTEEYRGPFEIWKQKNMESALSYISSYLLNAPQGRSRGGFNSSALEAFNAGLALHKAGDKTKALEFYAKAIAQEPGMIPALTNASLIYLENKEYENARSILQKWVRADPQAARPLALLGPLECNDGNKEKAVALLEKAITLEKDPTEKSRYEQLLSSLQPQRPGVMQAPAGEAAQVRESPSTVKETNAPKDEAIPKTGADESINRLEKQLASTKVESEKDWLHMMLGIAYFQAQNWEKAKEHLARILEKDPDNFSAREMMKTIEKRPQP
jgi:tetratricopeptide (TPR) repeat protein